MGLSFLIAGAVLYWGGTYNKDKGFTFLILGGISEPSLPTPSMMFLFLPDVCLSFCLQCLCPGHTLRLFSLELIWGGLISNTAWSPAMMTKGECEDDPPHL
jgi:hypothetical protein